MQTSKGKIGLGVGLVGLAFVGYVLYSTTGLARYTCEACITYRGNTSCGTASGNSREEAITTASDIACATISSGVTDRLQCDATTPDSITWLRE